MNRPKRKAIPTAVKFQVIERQKHHCAACEVAFKESDRVEFDHRPAIILREVNADGTDYIPKQNDPEYLQALHADCHLRRTVGRLPGAERTITTKGSDAYLAAKFRKLEGKNKPKRKQKILSRPFPKGRKFR